MRNSERWKNARTHRKVWKFFDENVELLMVHYSRVFVWMKRLLSWKNEEFAERQLRKKRAITASHTLQN